MRDRGTAIQAVRSVFDTSDVYGPLSELDGELPGIAHVWGRKYWYPPEGDLSFVGFLADAAYAEGLTIRRSPLRRLAARGGLFGCLFIIDLARLGTVLPDNVLRVTVRRLHKVASDTTLDRPGYRVRAAVALAELGDPRATDILHGLAVDADGLGSTRLAAARALNSLQDSRAAATFATLARDTAMREDFPSRSFRVNAAQELARLDHTLAADLLSDLARDNTLRADHRATAAQACAEPAAPRDTDNA